MMTTMMRIIKDLQSVGAGITSLADLAEIGMELILKIRNGGKDEQNQDV